MEVSGGRDKKTDGVGLSQKETEGSEKRVRSYLVRKKVDRNCVAIIATYYSHL